MRTIRFDFPVTRLKFRAQLRLETAARFFKLSFSARHVSQDCVQALWTQHQQSERQHEQDFRAEPHASPLVQALIVSNVCGWVGRFIFLSLHSLLKAADAFSDSLAQFRKLLRPKHEQG